MVPAVRELVRKFKLVNPPPPPPPLPVPTKTPFIKIPPPTRKSPAIPTPPFTVKAPVVSVVVVKVDNIWTFLVGFINTFPPTDNVKLLLEFILLTLKIPFAGKIIVFPIIVLEFILLVMILPI